jgi:hypothetical protein
VQFVKILSDKHFQHTLVTCGVTEEEGDVSVDRQEVLVLAEGQHGVADGRLATRHELEDRAGTDSMKLVKIV